MPDLVVTVPRGLWADWIAEGDAVGEPESGVEWGFFIGRHRPWIRPGERLYVVAHDRLRGYAPVTRVAFFPDSCAEHPGSDDAIALAVRAAVLGCDVCRGCIDGLSHRPPGARGRWAIGRKGGAVAVTLDQEIRGFRGCRNRWWDRSLEVPFPGWKTDDVGGRRARKAKAETGEHHCHALGCRRACPPEHLMCRAHWRRVPHDIQREVWATYRSGQCDDKKPSAAWHVAADRAIYAVAVKEGQVLGGIEAQWLAKRRATAQALAARVVEQVGLFKGGE